MSSLGIVLLVGLAGALGAVGRFTADRAIGARLPAGVPLTTVVINVVGSLALGVVVGAGTWHGLAPAVVQVLGTGLLGGFTTFSTVSLDAVQQARQGRWGWAAAIAGGGLAVCLAAAGAGLAVAWAL